MIYFVSTALLFILAAAANSGESEEDVSLQLLEHCRDAGLNESDLSALLAETGWKETEIDPTTALSIDSGHPTPGSLAYLFWFAQSNVGDNETRESVQEEAEQYAERYSDANPRYVINGFTSDRASVLTDGQSLFAYEFFPKGSPAMVQCNFAGPSMIELDVQQAGAVRAFAGKNISRYRLDEPFPVEDFYRISGDYASEIFGIELETMVFFSVRNQLN